CRTERSSWSGHQSLFVLGRCAVGVGDGMTGFSLSLPVSDTDFLLSRRTLDQAELSRNSPARRRRRRFIISPAGERTPAFSAPVRSAPPAGHVAEVGRPVLLLAVEMEGVGAR